jgi:hypothetical protein
MILVSGKGWPGMTLDRDAWCGAYRCSRCHHRPQNCSRVLPVFTGPSRQGQELGMSRPAAEQAAGRRLPASPRPGTAAVITTSRFAVQPMLRDIPAMNAPSAGRRGAHACTVDLRPSLSLSEFICLQYVLLSQIVGSPEWHLLQAVHAGEHCPPIRPGRGSARCATRGLDGTWPSRPVDGPLTRHPCS